jgi:chromosome segregation ATPase
MMNEQTQTAENLAAELAQKRDRLKEIEAQHAASTRAASAASRELADGAGAGAVEAVTAAQNRATALFNACHDLSSRIAALEAEQADLQAQAEREKKAVALCDLAARADEIWRRIEEKQHDAGDALFAACEAILLQRHELVATRREFEQLVGTLRQTGADQSGQNSMKYYESVPTAARRLLCEGGVEETSDLKIVAPSIGANDFPPEPAPLGYQINQAVGTVARHLERERAAQKV